MVQLLVIFKSFLDREKPSCINGIDYEKKIDNLTKDSNTEFVDGTAIENSESNISEAVILEN